MHVHLGGHLAFYDPHKRSRFEVHLEEETALLDVVRRLGVPEAEITLAAVNREVVALEEARVRDADRLDLYPPMSGGAQRAPAARSERTAAARAAAASARGCRVRFSARPSRPDPAEERPRPPRHRRPVAGGDELGRVELAAHAAALRGRRRRDSPRQSSA